MWKKLTTKRYKKEDFFKVSFFSLFFWYLRGETAGTLIKIASIDVEWFYIALASLKRTQERLMWHLPLDSSSYNRSFWNPSVFHLTDVFERTKLLLAWSCCTCCFASALQDFLFEMLSCHVKRSIWRTQQIKFLKFTFVNSR